MKAVLCERYGPPEVLRVAEVPKPAPASDEVLIKVRAASVTLGDCELRAFRFPAWIWLPLRLFMGVTRPRQPILGMEVAGVVEAIGGAVTKFAAGDAVFGSTSFAMGAYAEYKALKQSAPIVKIPPRLTYAQAAGIPTGGLNGLHFVRQAAVRPGERVLINGAGGSIGTFAVQIAKLHGAEVTAVDRGDKLDMLRGIGADHVIDYTAADFTRNGETYDVIIDVVGESHFGRSMRALSPNGRYVLGNPTGLSMIRGAFASRMGPRKVLFSMARESTIDLGYLADMVAAHTLTVVADRTYPLEGTPDAHRYVEAGNKKGIVVIDVDRAGERAPVPTSA